jgi:hypothetical protein
MASSDWDRRAKATRSKELGRRACDPDGRAEICLSDAIPHLVALLQRGRTNKHQRLAMFALLKLAMGFFDRSQMVSCGAVPLFIRLLQEGSDEQKEYAPSALDICLSSTLKFNLLLQVKGRSYRLSRFCGEERKSKRTAQCMRWPT